MKSEKEVQDKIKEAESNGKKTGKEFGFLLVDGQIAFINALKWVVE